MSCTEHQEFLVAYVRGDLAPLGAQRVESHLAHCDDCKGLERRVKRGLAAARGYVPEAPREHVALLNQRLAPYYYDGKAPRRRGLGALALATAGVGAFALALALMFTPRPVTEDVPTQPTIADARRGEAAPHLRYVATPDARRGEATPHLRYVASPDWDGVVTRDGESTTVHMTTGIAAFSFIGGEGRATSVVTPLGAVRVVGTRFSVGLVDDGMALQVGVAEGKVEVTSDGSSYAVAAGAELLLDGMGGVLFSGREPSRELDDAYLVEHHAGPVVELDLEMPRALFGVPSDTGDEALGTLLAEAEALAQAGRYDEALARYREAILDRRPAFRAQRDLSRYEMARIIGFQLQDHERARAAFEILAERAQGEVQRQARLALCELVSGCDAVACYGALEGDPSLRAEARRLGDLARRGCRSERP